MENFTGIPLSHIGQNSRQRSTTDISLWCAFGAGAMIAMAAMYIAVIAPLTDQLDQVQIRIAELDKTLRAVSGQVGTVKNANNLLGLLAEQRQKSHVAAGALADIRYLHDRLASQSTDIERRLTVLDGVDAIKDRLIHGAPQVASAGTALDALESLAPG